MSEEIDDLQTRNSIEKQRIESTQQNIKRIVALAKAIDLKVLQEIAEENEAEG